MASRRCADWRFPTEKQARAEETARRMQAAPTGVEQPGNRRDALGAARENTGVGRAPATPAGPCDPMPDAYWDAVLSDPVAKGQARRAHPEPPPLGDPAPCPAGLLPPVRSHRRDPDDRQLGQ